MNSTSRQSLGAYVGNDEILKNLEEEFGPHFEKMPRRNQIAMRAALACYCSLRPKWIDEGSDLSCMEICIESADAELWENEPKLCLTIQDCALLKPDDIDGLIEFLTAKIRYSTEVNR